MKMLPAPKVCIVVCPNLDNYHTHNKHDYVTYLITPYSIVDFPSYETCSYWINRHGISEVVVIERVCVECRKKGVKSPK